MSISILRRVINNDTKSMGFDIVYNGLHDLQVKDF